MIQIDKTMIQHYFEQAMNEGDLTAIDRQFAPDGIDHQEAPGTDIIQHLKEVIVALRTAFPDLHFEIHSLVQEGDTAAFRATMTGTHAGLLKIGPLQGLPPTGRKVTVPHMYFVRLVDDKVTDLWHQWDIPLLMRQLGIMPGAPSGKPASA
jgi:steroid delta-isomerase-like uncharacterized protein